MARTVLVVGQAPSSKGAPRGAFAGGASGRRLRELVPDFDRRCSAVNLLPDYHGPRNGRGDAFDLRRAREAAAALDLRRWRRVVLCGRGVAAAFGLSHVRPLCVVRIGRTAVLALPHPSPISLWWNSHRNVRRARTALERFLAR